MTVTDYRYDECGLDNVILKDLTVTTDDAGEECVHIPYVGALHKEIVRGLVEKASAITPKELRFLRTEMGLTQAELANLVRKDAQTIGRWERGEFPIDEIADMMLRVKAIQHLGIQCDMPPIEELARRSVPGPNQAPLIIDASNPTDYRLVA